MGERTPTMITVPLDEVLELIRLSSGIEYPNCTYVPDNELTMAQNAVRLMQQKASNISDILYKWGKWGHQHQQEDNHA